MPQLPEHISKRILAGYGVPVGDFAVAASADESADHAARIGLPVIIKALVPLGGRFKAGAVLRADTLNEAREAFITTTTVDMDGMCASSVLVAPFLSADAEYYLSVALNSSLGGPEVLLGNAGGVDIERQASVRHITLRRDGTLRGAQFRRAAYELGMPHHEVQQLSVIAESLAHAYRESDALLVELNPLGSCQGQFIALDARMIVDDNAIGRQPLIAQMAREMSPRRAEDVLREEAQIEYVRLSGPIGLISGGAGLTMAMMDVIAEAGSSAGCFMDCSGNPTRSGYGRALELLTADEQIKVILIHIFGGLTRLDSVARTLVSLIKESNIAKPVTVRLMGTNGSAADEILREAGLTNHRSLEEAVAAVLHSLHELQLGGRL